MKIKAKLIRRSRSAPLRAAVLVSMACIGLLAAGQAYPSTMPRHPKATPYDWLQFDFDEQHSGNNTREREINAGNVHHLQRRYRVSLPDVADGAPAYLGNVPTAQGVVGLIFLTTRDGHIIALNATTGKTVWMHQYGPGATRINNLYQPIYTTSSPAVDPDRQYVYSYGLDGYVHKFRVADGKEIKAGGWPELCTLKPFNEKGSSALAIATAKDGQSYLYVANGGYLGDRGDYQGHVTTINLRSGAQHVFNTNCSDNPVHFVQRPAEPDCPAVQSAIWARPGVIYDPLTDKVYMATGNGPFEPAKHDWGDTVFALNPDGTGRDGNPIDSYTPENHHDLDTADLDLGSTAPAILPVPPNCAIRSLAVQGGKDMKLRLVNLSDLSGRHAPGHIGGKVGKLLDVPQGGKVFTQPAVWVDPRDKSTWVFVATFSGLAGLKLRVDRRGLPSLLVMWQNDHEGSSPILANNVLYCAGSGFIRAYDPETGKILWKDKRIGKIHWESPIVADGVLYITDESGHLTAYGF